MEKVFLNSTDKVQDFIDSINLKDPESKRIKEFLEMTGFNEDCGKTDIVILAYYLDFLYDREDVDITSVARQSPKHTFMDKLKDICNLYTCYTLFDVTDLPGTVYATRYASNFDDGFDEDAYGNPEPPFYLNVDFDITKNIYSFIKLMESTSQKDVNDTPWYVRLTPNENGDGYEDEDEKICTLKGFLTYTHFNVFDNY